MNINNSELWISDIDTVIDNLPELKNLNSKSVLVTGSTGLICSAIVDVLIRWNEKFNGTIQIMAAGRNVEKVQNRFSPFSGREYFSAIKYDATNKIEFPEKIDYVIHGASNASPDKIVKEPVETMLSNFIGIKNILEYAKENKVKRVLYVSSSEVYGRKEHNGPSKTNDYGWIDLLESRNSYSISKCAAETLCSSYYDEYGVDSVIVRPGHIYGPTAAETDCRVSSAWAYDAAKGENIVMKSSGEQIRSYCYCLDCASAIIKVILNGKPVKAYNISNPDSIISIRKMAEVLAQAAAINVVIEKPTEQETKRFNPMIDSSLDSEELLMLGWQGLFDFKSGFVHTITILQDISSN